MLREESGAGRPLGTDVRLAANQEEFLDHHRQSSSRGRRVRYPPAKIDGAGAVFLIARDVVLPDTATRRLASGVDVEEHPGRQGPAHDLAREPWVAAAELVRRAVVVRKDGRQRRQRA